MHLPVSKKEKKTKLHISGKIYIRMCLLSLLGHPNKAWIKSIKKRLIKCTQSKHAGQMWDNESLDLLEQAAPSTTHSTRQKTIK